MIDLVCDTSVVIDLERGDLLQLIFSSPHYAFVVPDVLYHREMVGQWGHRLLNLGLKVEELSPAGVATALGYRSRQPALSLPDAFALALAVEKHWAMLTGDARLRQLAVVENVDCHGLLWLLDRIEEDGTIDAQTLHGGLQVIAGHPRCRLPRREVTIRLDHYRAKLAET